LKVSIEEISTCQRELTIEVPAEKITAEVEDLYKEIAKTATHPGFRKGKVPRKILEARHGNSIRQEAVSAAISSSAKDALDEHKLVPLTEPELGEVNDDKEGPLSFKVKIEVKPTVTLSDYTGIELKRVKREVTEEDVAQVLERLQLSHAKYAPAERAVEMGDFIVFDFQAFEDGKPVKDGKGENFSLEVGSGYFGEDFENQVVGLAKDEEKRIKVKYPDDYKSKELAGKELEFDVKVKDVKLRELPELDDDFAKDLGDHDTLEELKKSCRERLENDLEQRIEGSLRDQAIARIVADSEVEVPPRLKEKVAASVFEEQVRNLAQYGTDRETITAQRDQIAEFADKEAERQLKVSFLTDEIAERENLSISDEELEESLEKMAGESGDKGADLREYFKQEKIRERYREQLRAKKILDFIVSGAKIEEVDEAEIASESAESEQHEKDQEGDS
jgi:trigger factor